jgi:hypothetical protein
VGDGAHAEEDDAGVLILSDEETHAQVFLGVTFLFEQLVGDVKTHHIAVELVVAFHGLGDQHQDHCPLGEVVLGLGFASELDVALAELGEHVVLVLELPEYPFLEISGLALGEVELLFADFDVVLDAVLDGQVEEVLPDVLLACDLGGEFEDVPVLVDDPLLEQVVLLGRPGQGGWVFFLVIDEDCIAGGFAAGVLDLDEVPFIGGGFLEEVPLA